jgi:hypothetical protein
MSERARQAEEASHRKNRKEQKKMIGRKRRMESSKRSAVGRSRKGIVDGEERRGREATCSGRPD